MAIRHTEHSLESESTDSFLENIVELNGTANGVSNAMTHMIGSIINDQLRDVVNVQVGIEEIIESEGTTAQRVPQSSQACKCEECVAVCDCDTKYSEISPSNCLFFLTSLVVIFNN